MRILYNGRIRTLNPNQPHASAVAVDGGRIVSAGSDDQVLALATPGANLINLEGNTVWPGLTDAHIHLEHYARFLQMVDCETTTRQECLERVAQKARQIAPGAWLRGHGWNQNIWPEGFGDAALLDQAAPDHPAYLTAKSLHAGWANTAALQIAGINADTPDPENGHIARDANGRPTGILFENAMQLIDRAIPAPSAEELASAIEAAQAVLWSLGITGLHDFDGPLCFQALQLLHGRGKLKLRMIKNLPGAVLEHARSLGLRSGFGDDMLRIGSLKLFADGALGPHTAAMLEPYEGEDQTGMLFLNTEQVVEFGMKALPSGFSLAIHAIGDRANREIINAYEQLRTFEHHQGLPHYRHRIEHVQLLHPADHARLAKHNIIGSVQPIHATSDMDMADQFWGKRAANAYAYRTLHDKGTILAFGSDAPVESPNPFWGLHAAVTRRRHGGEPGPDGWYPMQRLSLAEALLGFTRGAAYAAGVDDRAGMIAPGYLADLIVLDVDPFAIDPQRLHAIQPRMTMVAGDWVWQA
ncbi:MAG: amidohydrolase [Anaerolineaceae bacterium]|jgi:predicted amidohydrolase YtcJ